MIGQGWVYLRPLLFSIVVMLALMPAACGDDNGNGNGATTNEVDTPEFFETTGVSTYAEFQDALDDAAEYSVPENEEVLDHDSPPEYAVAPDSTYLIEITDDIDDGFDEEGQLEYNGEVNLYIRGASGMQTIDAGGHSRILDDGSADKVWVEELRFVGGYSNGAGGAIRSMATDEFYIINCEFEHNHAADGTGVGGVSAYGHGGAVYVSAGPLEIIDSTFRDNSSDDHGGAINASAVIVRNSTFSNNAPLESIRGGGAIRAGRVDIEDSEFVDNGSGENGVGGALMVSHGGTISGSIFDGNEAGFGGAISRGRARRNDADVNEVLIISDSKFLNNHAENSVGGAIYATGDRSEDEATRISIEDSHFESNTISGSGDTAGTVATDANDEDILTANSAYIGNDEPLFVLSTGELIDDGGNTFEGNEDPFTE